MRPLRTLIPHRISFFSVVARYRSTTNRSINNCVFYTSGDHSEGVPPVPIPNTEVKPFSADGTAVWWESRSSPDVFFYPEGRRALWIETISLEAAGGANASPSSPQAFGSRMRGLSGSEGDVVLCPQGRSSIAVSNARNLSAYHTAHPRPRS